MPVQWETFSSRALRGYPMKDPHVRTFPVYLPPDYDPRRRRPYPVVFILAGWSAKGAAYLNDDSAFSIPLHKRLDKAISAGKMPPFIAVFPDGTSRLGCGQYVNSPALGRSMDYLCDELTAFIDSRYRTHASPDFRGVLGHSSGGFGALAIGFLRPDAFRWVCSSSGDSFYEVSYLSQINAAMIELEKSGGVAPFVKKFLGTPNPFSNLSKGQFEAMLLLSMAPCFAPNPRKPPLYGDLFFDWKTGAVIPEIWEKYLAWDPVRLIDAHRRNARQLRFVHLAAGLQDEHGLQWGHRQLARKLAAYKIPHELEEYPGRHGGHSWRFDSHLEKMLKRMLRAP